MYQYFPKQSQDDGGEDIYTTIIRLSDKAWIPMDENNKDYQDVLAWVEEGNTIKPEDEPEPEPAPPE